MLLGGAVRLGTVGGLGGWLRVVGLVLLHGGVVVHEDEGRRVCGIGVAGGARVAGTQVAGRVIFRQCDL